MSQSNDVRKQSTVPPPPHTPWRSWHLWLSRKSSMAFSEFTADAMNLARAFNPRTRMNENSDRASRKPFRRHNTTSLYNLWSVSALTSSNTASDWGFLASAAPASGVSVVNRSSAQFGCLRIIAPPLATIQPTRTCQKPPPPKICLLSLISWPPLCPDPAYPVFWPREIPSQVSSKSAHSLLVSASSSCFTGDSQGSSRLLLAGVVILELRSDLRKAGVGKRMCGWLWRGVPAPALRERGRGGGRRRGETSLPRRIPQRCVLTCRIPCRLPRGEARSRILPLWGFEPSLR